MEKPYELVLPRVRGVGAVSVADCYLMDDGQRHISVRLNRFATPDDARLIAAWLVKAAAWVEAGGKGGGK